MEKSFGIGIYAGGTGRWMSQLDFLDAEAEAPYRILITSLPEAGSGITLLFNGTALTESEFPKLGFLVDFSATTFRINVEPRGFSDASFNFIIPDGSDEPPTHVFTIDNIPLQTKTLFMNSAQETILITPDNLYAGESGDDVERYSYRLREVPSGGKLQLQSLAGVWEDAAVNTIFSQAMIDAGRVRYLVNKDEMSDGMLLDSGALEFRISDSLYDVDAIVELPIVVRQLVQIARIDTPVRDNAPALDYILEEQGVDIRATKSKDVIIGSLHDDKIDGGQLADEIDLDGDDDDATTGGRDEVIFHMNTDGGAGVRLTSGGDVIKNFRPGEDVLTFVFSVSVGAEAQRVLAESLEVMPIWDYANGVRGLYLIFKETIAIENVGLSGNIIQIMFDELQDAGAFIRLLGSDLSFHSGIIEGDTHEGTYAAIARVLGGTAHVNLEISSSINFIEQPATVPLEIADVEADTLLRTGWQFSVEAGSIGNGPYSFIIENADGTLNPHAGVLESLTHDGAYELAVTSSFTKTNTMLRIIPVGGDGTQGQAGEAALTNVFVGIPITSSEQSVQILKDEATNLPSSGTLDLGHRFYIDDENKTDYVFVLEARGAPLPQGLSLVETQRAGEWALHTSAALRLSQDFAFAIYATLDGDRVSTYADVLLDVIDAPTMAITQTQADAFTATFAEELSGAVVQFDGDNYIDSGYRFSVAGVTSENLVEHEFTFAASGVSLTDYAAFYNADDNLFGLYALEGTSAFDHDETITITATDTAEGLSTSIDVAIDVNNLRIDSEQSLAIIADAQIVATPPTQESIELTLHDAAAPTLRFNIIEGREAEAANGRFIFSFGSSPLGSSIGTRSLGGGRVEVDIKLVGSPTYRQLEFLLSSTPYFYRNFTYEYINGGAENDYISGAISSRAVFELEAPAVSTGIEISVGLDAAVFAERHNRFVIKNNDGSVNTDFSLRNFAAVAPDKFALFVSPDATFSGGNHALTIYAETAAGVRLSENIEVEVIAELPPSLTLAPQVEIAPNDSIPKDTPPDMHLDLGYRFTLTDDLATTHSFTFADAQGDALNDYSVRHIAGDTYGLFAAHDTQSFYADREITITATDNNRGLSGEITIDVDIDNYQNHAGQTQNILAQHELGAEDNARTNWIDIGVEANTPRFRFVINEKGADVLGLGLRFIFDPQEANIGGADFDIYRIGKTVLIEVKFGTHKFEDLRAYLESQSTFTGLAQWEYEDPARSGESFTSFVVGTPWQVNTLTIPDKHIGNSFYLHRHADDIANTEFVISYSASGERTYDFALQQDETNANIFHLYADATKTFAADDFNLDIDIVDSVSKEVVDTIEDLLIKVDAAPTLANSATQTISLAAGVPTLAGTKFASTEFLDTGVRFALSDDTQSNYNFVVLDQKGDALAGFHIRAVSGNDYALVMESGTQVEQSMTALTIRTQDANGQNTDTEIILSAQPATESSPPAPLPSYSASLEISDDEYKMPEPDVL